MADRDANTMHAVVQSVYGGPDVLRLAEVEKPIPSADEILVQVVAASVGAGDWHLMRGTPFLVRLIYGGYRRPKFPVLGVDIAGRVEKVGRNVTSFKQGDDVLADLSEHGFGGFAEYVCVPATALVSKPATVSFEMAAAAPTSAVAAIQALRDVGDLKDGERVLINGASGGVGSFAVQIAKYFGAVVSAVSSSTKAEMVRSIGADHVIDYTEEDITTSGIQYDLIIDTAGSYSMRAFRRALTQTGRYVMVGGPTSRFLQVLVFGPILSMTGDKKFRVLNLKVNRDDLAFVARLLKSENVAPVIGRRYELHEVPEAIRYLEDGHAKGKLVIRVEHVR